MRKAWNMNLQEAKKIEKKLRKEARQRYLKLCEEDVINPRHYLLSSEAQQWVEAINIINKDVIDNFKRWGSKGGKKKGSTKVRGDSEYYRNIAKK